MEAIHVPPGPLAVLSMLEEAGFAAYVVGGCVRDSLLGRTPRDWDICTSARPAQMRRCFARPGVETADTGGRYGTLTVALEGQGRYEVTTFRVDGPYGDCRRPDRVEFVDSLRPDLARRDFTVNAMAYRPGEGLTDPFGGAADLRARVLACVGEPEERFAQDALRLMRALRLAAVYGLTLAPDTARAARAGAGLLSRLPPPRLSGELLRLLCAPGALDVLLGFPTLLAAAVPELGPCIGFDQHSRYHPYTVYDHTAHAVAAYGGDDPQVKLALLLHDIGKPRCFTLDGDGGHFHGHAAAGSAMARAAVRRLGLDRETAQAVEQLVLYHDTPIEPQDVPVRRWLRRLSPRRLRQLAAVKLADNQAHTPGLREPRARQCRALAQAVERVLAQNPCVKVSDLAIGGRELLALGAPPGRTVGRLLEGLLDQVVEGRLENRREALLDWAGAWLEGEAKSSCKSGLGGV